MGTASVAASLLAESSAFYAVSAPIPVGDVRDVVLQNLLRRRGNWGSRSPYILHILVVNSWFARIDALVMGTTAVVDWCSIDHRPCQQDGLGGLGIRSSHR